MHDPVKYGRMNAGATVYAVRLRDTERSLPVHPHITIRPHGTDGRFLPIPAEDRFWLMVNKDGPVPTDRPDLGPCWIWRGSPNFGGYGFFEDRMAHRWAYEHFVGPIPTDLTLDHLCRNRPCVNTSHLEPVTLRENILRGNGSSAHHARQTHCIHGHPFDEPNTCIWQRNGQPERVCRACRNERLRQIRARKAALKREAKRMISEALK